MCSVGSPTLFGLFPADQPKFWPGHGGDPQVKNRKMRIFLNLSKFVLDDYRYQIRLPNHSRTPQTWFSGQYRPLWRKSYFRPKIIIFAKCDKSQYGMESGRKWPKSWKNIWKCILQVPKILLNTQDVTIQCLSLILLRFEKSSFSPIVRVFGHFAENYQKTWFFDVWVNVI